MGVKESECRVKIQAVCYLLAGKVKGQTLHDIQFIAGKPNA